VIPERGVRSNVKGPNYVTSRSEFVDHILELMSGLGPVTARAMFGGHGVYLDQQMFGLVARDVLYLKVDEQNRARFDELELEPFTYTGKDRTIRMSYREAPVDALEDPDVMIEWATSAHEAGMRAHKTKRKR
jgi:DNA transformation protein